MRWQSECCRCANPIFAVQARPALPPPMSARPALPPPMSVNQPSIAVAQRPKDRGNQDEPQSATEPATSSALQPSDPAPSWALQPSEVPVPSIPSPREPEAQHLATDFPTSSQLQPSGDLTAPRQAERRAKAPVQWSCPPQQPAVQPVATDASTSSQLQASGQSAMPPGFDIPDRVLPASTAVTHDVVVNDSEHPAPQPSQPALVTLAPNSPRTLHDASPSRSALQASTTGGLPSLHKSSRRNDPTQRTPKANLMSAASPELPASRAAEGQPHASFAANQRSQSPSRGDDRTQHAYVRRASSRSDTRGAGPASQPSDGRPKTHGTPPKQLPLKRASADTVIHSSPVI